MKNLSKVLSLVLALAMIVGVFTIGAAAFTDDEDIKYDEAVEVMAGIGVINGFEDGSFDPDGTLTREQAAKIICYMTLGKTLADALVTEKAPFEDVKATRWSAGYIAYCVQEGIIGGYGNGKFGPADNVTGYQFAKMLLVALGFDAEENGLVGANWTINTAKLAVENKLFVGNLGADYTKAAAREEAALYAFNALFYGTKTVTETATKFVVSATKASLAEISGNYYDTFDAAKAAAKAKDSAAVYGTDYTVTSMAITSEKVEGSLADQVFGLKKDTTADKFGRPGTAYTVDGEALTFSAAAPVLSYTTPVQGKQIYAALGLTKVPTITETVDGTPVTAKNVTASSTDVFGGNGTVTEVYKTATGKYTIVEINTYFDTVKSVKTTTDATTGVKTTTLTLTGGLTTTKLVDFAKKDAVLYTKAGTEIMSMEKAGTITGTLTKAVNNSQYTIDGKTYAISATSALTNDAIVGGTSNTNMGKSVAYYVDAQGNLMAAVDTTAAATAGTYIKVLAAATPSTNADYMNTSGEYTGKVYGILSDGTYGEYTVNYGTGTTAATKNAIYEYEFNAAGQMVLSTSTVANTTAPITAGTTVVNTNKVLNSNTTFIFYTQKSASDATVNTLTVKKGNANSGTVAAGATLVYENDVVIAVYVGGTYADGSEVVDAAYVDASTEIATTEAEVVNGSVVTKTVYTYKAYTASGDELTLSSSTKILADGVYKYNDDNTVGAAAATITGTIKLFGSTIQVGSNYYGYNADMVAFLGEDVALAEGQTVIAIANAAGNALTHIWVTVDAPAD